MIVVDTTIVVTIVICVDGVVIQNIKHRHNVWWLYDSVVLEEESIISTNYIDHLKFFLRISVHAACEFDIGIMGCKETVLDKVNVRLDHFELKLANDVGDPRDACTTIADYFVCTRARISLIWSSSTMRLW